MGLSDDKDRMILAGFV